MSQPPPLDVVAAGDPDYNHERGKPAEGFSWHPASYFRLEIEAKSVRMTDAGRFRNIMGNFATGVTVVTSPGRDSDPCGLTANAVASVSLDPLLVLVCLDRKVSSHDCIIEGGVFGISILAAEDEELARRFSQGARAARFEGLDVRQEITGSPILKSALAWLDCRVREIHYGGDHSIVVGEVLSCDARDGDPLVFLRGEYRRMPV